MAAQVFPLLELQIRHPAVRDQLEHPGDLLLLQRREELLGLIHVDGARLVCAGARGVHPGQLLHRRRTVGQVTALDLRAHPFERLGDRDDVAPRGMQRRGVDGLALAKEQQHALVRQVRGEIAVDAAVAVAFRVRHQVFEMNECEAGAMNKPVHLRKLEIREANRRIRQESGARAHRPPKRKLREMLLDLLLERRRRIRSHERVHVTALFEE